MAATGIDPNRGTREVIDDSNFCGSRDAAKCYLNASLFGTSRERDGEGWGDSSGEAMCNLTSQRSFVFSTVMLCSIEVDHLLSNL